MGRVFLSFTRLSQPDSVQGYSSLNGTTVRGGGLCVGTLGGRRGGAFFGDTLGGNTPPLPLAGSAVSGAAPVVVVSVTILAPLVWPGFPACVARIPRAARGATL